MSPEYVQVLRSLQGKMGHLVQDVSTGRFSFITENVLLTPPGTGRYFGTVVLWTIRRRGDHQDRSYVVTDIVVVSPEVR